MANVKLLFGGTEQSKTQEHSLQIVGGEKDIYIEIDMDTQHEFGISYICLDKETAIKLHRELKKQISFLTE